MDLENSASCCDRLRLQNVGAVAPEAQERRHLTPKQAGWNGWIPVEPPGQGKGDEPARVAPSPRLRRDVLQPRLPH